MRGRGKTQRLFRQASLEEPAAVALNHSPLFLDFLEARSTSVHGLRPSPSTRCSDGNALYLSRTVRVQLLGAGGGDRWSSYGRGGTLVAPLHGHCGTATAV